MRQGWIRDWPADTDAYFAAATGTNASRNRRLGRRAQREFRRGFSAEVFATEDGNQVVATLGWGTRLQIDADDVPETRTGRCRVTFDAAGPSTQGWVARSSVAYEAFVQRPADAASVQAEPDLLQVRMRASPASDGRVKIKLLWGDPLQLISREGEWYRAAARGWQGWLHRDDVGLEGLLEVYFIDVGQGDGVLVRGPDGRHLLIDGGLPRSHQQSGKNAADFVDWKFFVDYGEVDVSIDAMVASHCDKDHYGGLDDLVSPSPNAARELDAAGVRVDTLFHAGLSYWDIDDAERAAFPEAPADSKWLGPELAWNGEGRDEFGSFRGSENLPAKALTRVFTDDIDVADAVDESHHPHLAGDWRRFFERCGDVGASSVGFAGLPFAETGTAAFLTGWSNDQGLQIRVLGPLTLNGPDGPALPDFGSNSQNTNGHSILLRLDYGSARILLTGDLNQNSMHYLLRGYAGQEDELACDVAKACHHGSADISLRFLQHVQAAATVISSGDSEGYGHPTPEVVGASAITGFTSIDTDNDVLRTPLVYSTEVERGVSLGAVKHLGFARYPVDDDTGIDGTLFAKPPSNAEQKVLFNKLRDSDTQAEFAYTYFKGVWTRKSGRRSLNRARILDRVNYGLVNVRTDGEVILCATQTDAGGGWEMHAFSARFTDGT